MPWHVENDLERDGRYWVVDDSGGSIAGCHDSEADALDQIAALYASEAASAREPARVVRERPGSRHGPLGRRDRRLLPDQVVRRLNEAFGDQALAVAHRGFDIDYAGQRLEHRATKGQLELRQAEGTDPVIHGYATIYGNEYDVWGGPPFGFKETIELNAAAKSIQERDEVYLFFDHEGLPLAATKAGTLDLTSDSRGLYNVARPDPASIYSM